MKQNCKDLKNAKYHVFKFRLEKETLKEEKLQKFEADCSSPGCLV